MSPKPKGHKTSVARRRKIVDAARGLFLPEGVANCRVEELFEAYLFECLEPEVFAICHEQENQMTTAFFAKGAEWLEGRAAAGQIHKLSFLEYYVLWMGPTLELTRTWLMNVQQKWTWMPVAACAAASLQYRIATGPRTGKRPTVTRPLEHLMEEP